MIQQHCGSMGNLLNMKTLTGHVLISRGPKIRLQVLHLSAVNGNSDFKSYDLTSLINHKDNMLSIVYLYRPNTEPEITAHPQHPHDS